MNLGDLTGLVEKPFAAEVLIQAIRLAASRAACSAGITRISK